MTQTDANRLICADTLRAYARLVEMGAIEAFDLVWNLKERKPLGKHVVNASFFKADVEIRLEDETEEALASMDQIQVVDGTKHVPCDSPDCLICLKS